MERVERVCPDVERVERSMPRLWSWGCAWNMPPASIANVGRLTGSSKLGRSEFPGDLHRQFVELVETSLV